MYLLDTNVISEYRKGNRADRGVCRFFESTRNGVLFLPAQVIGEIQAGIFRLRRLDDGAAGQRADTYQLWLDGLVAEFKDHVLEFDVEAARVWGTMLSHEKKDPHTIDKQIAAMALVNDLTVVTRDKGDAFARIPGLRKLNPFG
ncbi:type II toxin-antitoxin system VapC family toxin [Massilia sp. METH4]|uniref:type II toxin-antitoxin system VapC family toxin n=1 Tax=Massilia sp. METH4 TaxID=3123041 RepID=UPI0030CA93A6